MKNALILIIILLLCGCGVTKKLTDDTDGRKYVPRIYSVQSGEGIVVGDSIANNLCNYNGKDLEYATGVKWYNCGHSGSDTYHWIEDGLFRDEVQATKPSHLIINVGVNNVLRDKTGRYISDMLYMVNWCIDNNIKVYVLTLTARDAAHWQTAGSISLNIQLKEQLPSACILIDTYTAISYDKQNYYDEIHPNTTGNIKIIDEIQKVFIK